MFLWTLSILFFLLAVKCILPPLHHFFKTIISALGTHRQALDLVVLVLQELEDLLLTGLVPAPEKWTKLSKLPHPWGSLASTSLKELRDAGGSLIPTLKRLRSLAEAHRAALENAKAKASPAIAQGVVCLVFVPIVGFGLYILLPGLKDNRTHWLMACGVALFISALGSLWLLKMSDAARWGGLPPAHRSWMLSAQCAGERFLALVRTGVPPDMAWAQACELLKTDSLELANAWGYSAWDIPIFSSKISIEQAIVDSGGAIKRSIQVSLMEGRPCTERVETVLYALRQDIESNVDKRLGLLATHALKPLFICVAPSLFGLLACALWMAIEDIGGPGILNAF